MPFRYQTWFALAALLFAACGGSGSQPASGTPDALKVPFETSNPFLTSLPTSYRLDTLLDGLDFPSAIAVTPDGRLLITEQYSGRVRVVRDGVLENQPWIEIPVYTTKSFLQELGLVSIAVDPKFEENRYVYLYYTEPAENGHHTVLARVRDENGRGVGVTPILTIDRAAEKTHIAGGLAFDSTGALLVGVGDHEQAPAAPDLSQPVGKVLRIDRDGNALPDNPFARQSDADPRVYAYGVRNPFGITLDRSDGKVYFTDNRDTAGDAVYELLAGADYGWPEHRTAVREPLVVYQQPTGVAGIAAYNATALPEFDGDLFYCTFHGGGGLHWSDPRPLAGFDLAKRDRLIAPGCSTGVAVGADGFLYMLVYGEGKLLRIGR